MKLKTILVSIFFISLFYNSYSQTGDDVFLAKIKNEGYKNSQAMNMLGNLTDLYGQRLTGSREYFAAAQWISDQMKDLGIQKVHFENYCNDCRGWGIKSFNVEMTSPNFMHINAYPLAMSKSTKGIVEGSLIHIRNSRDMQMIRKEYTGKLKGKIVLIGNSPQTPSLTDPISKKYSLEELSKLDDKIVAETKQTPLPQLFDSWKVDDISDQDFLKFLEAEGVLALFTTRSLLLGVLHPAGTYYYKEGQHKPLPYFTIMPEQFGRLARMIEKNTIPTVRLNLETEFYLEPSNNVNIIGELTGKDSKLKTESILLGAHFDSWHAGTGATDNGANVIVLIEALRILKNINFQPKRTITIGLWGGEEQAFLGSAAYAKDHFGSLKKQPNKTSKQVSAYLNLDNGAGAIRGIYLQDNEFARPVFKNIFKSLPMAKNWALTIENTLSTDHETFDHYGIPSFQFIQEPLAYSNVTHHTQLDVLEYVPEEDIMKNAVILAWTIYKITNRAEKLPRK